MTMKNGKKSFKDKVRKENHLTIRVTDSLLESVQLMAEKLEVRRTDIIRRAIVEFIKKHGNRQ